MLSTRTVWKVTMKDLLVLSDNPELLQIQLQQLVDISEKKLVELTSPVILFTDEELNYHNSVLRTGFAVNGYQPPPTRFAKISQSQKLKGITGQ